MPHVSKIKLNKKAEEELIKNLDLVLSKIGKNEEMVVFLNSLLTETERLMIAKRLAVILLLEQGLHDVQISSMLNVTRMTISKMRLFYEGRGKDLKIGVTKLAEQKNIEDFKKLLASLARYSVRAAGGYVKI